MNEISLNYDFNGAPVRVVGTFDEPWFVAADVTDALGLSRKQIRRLDDDGKGVRLMHTLGGEQEMAVISESGMYTLILTSRKAEAKAFKRWLTHEVLPSIRKTGGYIHDFELFLTHPIMQDLEAEALERVPKSMEQMIRHHATPFLEKKHADIPHDKLKALLSNLKWYIFSYFPDEAGNIKCFPKSKRKARPSQYIIPGRTEKEAEEAYRMMHKHIAKPLMTLAEYKARVCDRPSASIPA